MKEMNLFKKEMTIMKKIFLGLVCSFLISNNVFATSPSVEDVEEKSQIQRLEAISFDKKDADFWVLKHKEAFKAVDFLVDKNGDWRGESPIPHYLKFVEELQPEDVPTLQKWLSLNGLECFAIADQKEQPNISLVIDLYEELKEQEKKEEQENLSKLAWLNYKGMLYELEQRETSFLSDAWVETNRAFQMKNSHYREIGSH